MSEDEGADGASTGRTTRCVRTTGAAAATAIVVLHSIAEGQSRSQHPWLPHYQSLLSRRRLSDGWRRAAISRRSSATRVHPCGGLTFGGRGFPPRAHRAFKKILLCCCETLSDMDLALVPAVDIDHGTRNTAVRNRNHQAPSPPCSDHDHEPSSQARTLLEARREQTSLPGLGEGPWAVHAATRGLVTSHAARSCALCRELV